MNNINKRDACGETVLHRVVRNNNVLQIKNLISRGADVNVRDACYWTPLHMAAIYNTDNSHLATIELLLKNGANANAQDQNGKTPTEYLFLRSMVNNCKKSIQFLLNFKAADGTKSYGKNLMLQAVERSDIYKIQMLMDNGMSANIGISSDGSTPLHIACRSNDIKMIKFLLNNGADMDAIDLKGRAPLMHWIKESEKMLKFLLKYADFNKSNVLSSQRAENVCKTILRHYAKLQALNTSLNQNILKTIYGLDEYKDYFEDSVLELSRAKSWQLKNSLITFFDLLIYSNKKLEIFASNEELVSQINKSNCLDKFPIYGQQMKKNVNKGIERCKLFDKSAKALSYLLPIFNQNRIIIEDILDGVKNTKDLLKLLQ